MDMSQAAEQEKNNTKGIRNPWLTPPEAIADSFEPTKPKAPIEPASPPESPAFGSFPRSHSTAQDEALFPADTDVPNVHSSKPLFDSNTTSPPCEQKHSPARADSHFSTPERSPITTQRNQIGKIYPTRERRVDHGPPALSPHQLYNKFGSAYYDFVMAENEERQRLQRQLRELPLPVPTSTRDPHTAELLGRLAGPSSVRASNGRIEKPRHTHLPARVRSPTQKPIASRPVRSQETSRAEAPLLQARTTSHSTTTNSRRARQRTTSPRVNNLGVANAPQPKPRTRAAPSKTSPISGDWRKIPDYCPPLSILDKYPDVMVAWKNAAPRSVDGDPMAEQLHPLEKKWAEGLRMKAEQYLECRRRIFRQRVEELKTGGDFNKTKAQYCCTIDVNKTSQLWTVYNEVGWFDEQFFRGKLDGSESTSA